MGSWKLGRAFGIDIFVHWTFFLLLGYVTLQARGNELGPTPLHVALLIVLIFGCVVLHELGHALMARRFGVATRDITLYPIGGVARLERMPERPFEEICVALAGPAVNVVIAALLLASLLLQRFVQGSVGIDSPLLSEGDLLTEVLLGNVILVLFNMLPAFPSDGGRVLRALLVTPFGRLKATRIAATVGAVFAFLFVACAIITSSVMLAVVAVFLFLAGQQELAYVRYQSERPSRSLLPHSADVLDVEPVPVTSAFTGMAWDQDRRVWVLWQDGRPVRTYWMPGSQG